MRFRLTDEGLLLAKTGRTAGMRLSNEFCLNRQTSLQPLLI
jgi:hypothetical protein